MVRLLVLFVLIVEASAQGGEPPAIEIQQIRDAVARSLPLLEKASVGSADNRTCFTCHSQALPVMALAEARLRGFSIDETNFKRQIEHTHAHLERGKQPYLDGKGQGGRVDTAGFALWTLEAGEWQPDETTAAVTHYLLATDREQGYWKRSSNRPPSEASHFATTYLALRALEVFGTAQQYEQIVERKQAVAKWLTETTPTDTEDRVFQLRCLEYVDVDKDHTSRLAAELLAQQRDDGSWGQLADLPGDSYATATALIALSLADQLPIESQNYQRGIRFLINTQKEDGSWHVVSRSKPFQEYFETGFPHGKDQFISTTASGWATIALLLALPVEK